MVGRLIDNYPWWLTGTQPVRWRNVFRIHSLARRKRLLQDVETLPTYRARQRRRAQLGVGTLADYAWFGTRQEWERAAALAKAGHEELI